MTFNEKVDSFMKENNIKNLKQLAILSDIPYTTLRDFYEKESADNSRFSTIKKLSTFMKCTMDYLAYDDLLTPNQCKIDGLDISDETYINFNKIDEYNSKLDRFDLLYNQNKGILTEDDKEHMEFIINKRIREIDKQLDGE